MPTKAPTAFAAKVEALPQSKAVVNRASLAVMTAGQNDTHERTGKVVRLFPRAPRHADPTSPRARRPLAILRPMRAAASRTITGTA